MDSEMGLASCNFKMTACWDLNARVESRSAGFAAQPIAPAELTSGERYRKGLLHIPSVLPTEQRVAKVLNRDVESDAFKKGAWVSV